MRFAELICFSVILALFSSLFSSQIFLISKMDRRLETIKKEADSLVFISESFLNACKGKGFSSLDEWKTVCSSMWNLEEIEWSFTVTEKSSDDEEGKKVGFYSGSWKGPFGSGEVYEKE